MIAQWERKLEAGARVAHAIFTRMGWTWGYGPAEHAPSREEILETMRSLVEDALEGHEAGTGRLWAVPDYEEGEVVGARVGLELAELGEYDAYL